MGLAGYVNNRKYSLILNESIALLLSKRVTSGGGTPLILLLIPDTVPARDALCS